MAKRIDINSFHNRFERDGSRNKRAVGTRNQRVYFLIVCEGQKTEPHYFSSFNNSLPPYTLDIETQGEGCDPLGVVNAAIELKKSSPKPLNSIWAVFDKDDFPASRFHQAIEKEMNQKILEQDGKKGKFIYRKNAKDMHDLLLKYGNEAQAIKWAEKLAGTFDTTEYVKHNPCTMVFRLVDELNNPGKV